MQSSQYRLMYELEDLHFWFLAKREFFKALIKKSPKRLRILDLGCGTGGMSVFLENYGTVTRVESAKNAQSFLKKRSLKFISANIENYIFRKNYFDLICFFDVLYHKNIKNPDKLINKAYDCLKKNGTLVIIDSALPLLLSEHDQVMETRERFLLTDLAKRVRQSGFEIEKKSYIYFFIFPLTLVARMLNKFVQFENVSPLPSILNDLLFTICKLEAVFIRFVSFPIGSSILIKAKKR